jgi:hypothetical protein
MSPMPSNDEPSAPGMCTATTAAGKPCRKQAVERGLCTFHSGAVDLAAAGRKGGQARGKKQPQETSARLEEKALGALEGLLGADASPTAQSKAIALVLDRVSPSSSFAIEAARKALHAESEARMKAELPFARERLARLIESRATEKAKEMHKEQRRLEVEAVRAELEVAPEETPETPIPEVDEPAPSAPSAADLQQQIADELARSEAERLRRELGLEQDDLRGMS